MISEPDMKRKDAKLPGCNQKFLECGGKRSATPLWKFGPQSKSGVVATLCHRSPKSSLVARTPSVCPNSHESSSSFLRFLRLFAAILPGRRQNQKGLTGHGRGASCPRSQDSGKGQGFRNLAFSARPLSWRAGCCEITFTL